MNCQQQPQTNKISSRLSLARAVIIWGKTAFIERLQRTSYNIGMSGLAVNAKKSTTFLLLTCSPKVLWNQFCARAGYTWKIFNSSADKTLVFRYRYQNDKPLIWQYFPCNFVHLNIFNQQKNNNNNKEKRKSSNAKWCRWNRGSYTKMQKLYEII